MVTALGNSKAAHAAKQLPVRTEAADGSHAQAPSAPTSITSRADFSRALFTAS